MRICMLTTGHRALDDRIFYKEALSLRKKYDDIYVVAPDEKGEHMENGIHIVGVRTPVSLLDRIKLVDEVIDEAIKLKAHIYHFHDFEIIYKAMRIKRRLPDAKIVYDVHEFYPDMIRMSHKIPSFLKPAAAYIVDKSETVRAKKFDYIISADDAVKERFEKYNPNVDVIYNFSEFNIRPVSKCTKEYDCIYQGGITLERGVFNVVKAIEIVSKTKPDVRMIFVGPFDDAEAKEMVFKYIKDKGLDKNIEFIGRVPHSQVEGYVRKSRMGIVTLLPYPKYFKNIPIKQFEYMSCGIPVIGSDLPPIKKFITSYNSGLIVDPTNPEEIAAAILKLMGDPQLCSELGANGVRAVMESYNWANMERKLLNIYGSME